MIEFRPLAGEDLPLLHRWLNEPHLRRFYQREPITAEAVRTRYLPRIRGEKPVRCHVALLDGNPVGKLQCYLNRDYPDFAAEIGAPDGISVDYFLGEPAFLGKGVGRAMVAGYLAEAYALFPEERRIYLCHETENHAAIACARAAGFRFLRHVTEDGAACSLLVHER